MFSLAAPTKVFYLGTDPLLSKPGEYNLSIKGDHIRLQEPMKNKKFGISIPYSSITDVNTSYDVKDKSVSYGKAIAGDILAGPIGAIAGAGMGKKKVEQSLVINYTTETGQQRQLVANTKHAELLVKKIQKHLS